MRDYPFALKTFFQYGGKIPQRCLRLVPGCFESSSNEQAHAAVDETAIWAELRGSKINK